MAESKTQKVSKAKAVQAKVLCPCGGEMRWVRYAPGFKSGHMRCRCETCGQERK